jgi:hypothetical protein
MEAYQFSGRVAQQRAYQTRQAQRFDFAVIFAAQAVDRVRDQAALQAMQAGLMGVDQAAVRAQAARLMVARVDHALPVHFSQQQVAAVARGGKLAQRVAQAVAVAHLLTVQQARAVAVAVVVVALPARWPVAQVAQVDRAQPV